MAGTGRVRAEVGAINVGHRCKTAPPLQIVAALLALVLNAVPATAQPKPESLRELIALVSQGHCESAVAYLNPRLKDADSATLTFAAAMFEEGVCVRKDWRRAEALYLRADPMKHRAARLRLVAGYARLQAGPDFAAALWWDTRGASTTGAACRVGAAAGDDPDAFVKELQSWSASKLAQCVYVAALLSGLVADIEYPFFSFLREESGTVRVTYHPAAARMEAELDGDTPFRRKASWLLTDPPPQRGRGLVDHVRELSWKANQGLNAPTGFDPDLTYRIDFVFVLSPR